MSSKERHFPHHLMLLEQTCLDDLLPKQKRAEDYPVIKQAVPNFIETIVERAQQMKFDFKTPVSAVRTALGLVLASSIGMATAQTANTDKVVASLGKVTITQSEISRLLQGMSENERAAVKGNQAGVENWLRQRLVSEALLREAKAKGWAERPEIKSRVDAAVTEVTSQLVGSSYLESVTQVPADYPSAVDLQAAYDQGKDNFKLPEMYRVAQIYLANTGTDAASVAKVRDEAKRIAGLAKKGDFAELARTNSQDKTSAQRGGEVGMLPVEQMLPEVRDAVKKLKPGQISDPIAAATGVHIIKLLETQAPRTATLDEVKPQLQAALRQQRKQQLVQSYLATLAPANQVSIDNSVLNAALQK